MKYYKSSWKVQRLIVEVSKPIKQTRASSTHIYSMCSSMVESPYCDLTLNEGKDIVYAITNKKL